ncbi:hypothetical protein BGZ96_004412 [Linnemannia gamsii]|uniref:F-box domain-containing protein n=1 Tax=Linnemannia gamsii TaxID=64522 RepID=A0ABQ7K5Q4_9FUNG|nr:hypothetical protein BGZ96_004412 [Linnemannia gamsii]
MNSFERTTVFEIPLLLDMIHQHLDPSDFQNCSRVNRILFHAFQPYLWRTLRLLGEWYPNLDATSTTVEEREGAIAEQQSLFLNKSAWIRCQEYDQYHLLSDLNPGVLLAFRDESRCYSLSELSTTFIDEEGAEHPEEEEEEEKEDEGDEVNSLFVENPQTNKAIKVRNLFAAEALGALVGQNTRLSKCEVNLGSIDSWVLPVLMEPLKRHPHLRELRISKWTHFRGPILEKLLKYLPPSLEVLWLNWEKVPPAGQDRKEYDEQEMSFGFETYLNDGSEDPWLESFPSIREVHLMGVYSGLRGSHIPRFLKTCLNLHTLTWPGWSIYRPSILDPFSFIFNLSHLHNHQGGSRIKHLAFNMGAFDDTLHTILPRPILEFGPEARVSCTDTFNLLQTCPHLLIYRVESLLKLSCIHVAKFKVLSGNTWVCRDLQVLQISFIDCPACNEPFIEHDLALDQEDFDFFQVQASINPAAAPATNVVLPNRKWIRKIYRQLGALTRLRTLILGSQGPLGDSTTVGEYLEKPLASLDMSLESGLFHLKDLTDLQVLNVQGVKFLKIGADEMSWMQQHWPQLKQVTGLSSELQEQLRAVMPVGSGLVLN